MYVIALEWNEMGAGTGACPYGVMNSFSCYTA